MGRLLPLAAFLALGVLLAIGLSISDRKTLIPSPLIGKPAPEFALASLHEPELRISRADLLGEPYLANFWASWCVTCRVEHPVITRLSESGRVRIIGFNFRDTRDDALAWLQRWGDPYDLHLSDLDGRISIDFGVYAAPETFLVSPQGEIVYKHIGALTEEIIVEEIMPLLVQMVDELTVGRSRDGKGLEFTARKESGEPSR